MSAEIIAIIVTNGIFNLLSFYLGAKLSRGEKVIPLLPGKNEIIDVEPQEDRYGDIWPQDHNTYSNEAM